MDKDLIKQIKNWIKDYKATQPQNLDIDNDAFDGGAYNILENVLAEAKKLDGKLKIIVEGGCLRSVTRGKEELVEGVDYELDDQDNA